MQALTIRDNTELAVDPRKAIAQATEAATALMEVVEQQGWFLALATGRHLYVEAWELVGSFYGFSAGIDGINDVRDLHDDAGQYIGSQAYVTLVDRNGTKLGGADAVCLREEPGREAIPIFQMRSMAQTRAVSKAYRLKVGWVARMAGFSATPAEEMDTEADVVTKMNIPRCPTHPRRVPKEWSNGKAWKCTAKLPDGTYCKWEAPRTVEGEAHEVPVVLGTDSDPTADKPFETGSRANPPQNAPAAQHPASEAKASIAQRQAIGDLAKSIWGEGWEGELKAWLWDAYRVSLTSDLTASQVVGAAYALESRLADLQLVAQETAQGAIGI